MSGQYFCLYRRNPGSVLIIVIWILVFFSILSLGLYNVICSQLKTAKALEEKVICCQLAGSACLYAQLQKRKSTVTYDTLYKLSAKEEKELGGGKFIYTIIDEESKININTASCETISRLPGLDMDIAQSIMASSLRPFHLKEELLLVEDMTEELYNGFKDFITVYSTGKININTAPGEILAAVGFDDDLVNIIKEYRAGKDKKEATADDGIFESSAGIINSLRAFKGLTGSQEALLLQAVSANLFTTQSNNLGLQIQTSVYGRQGMKYAIIISSDKIKEWREY